MDVVRASLEAFGWPRGRVRHGLFRLLWEGLIIGCALQYNPCSQVNSVPVFRNLLASQRTQLVDVITIAPYAKGDVKER